MSSITKLKRKFKKIPAFITCAASQSHDSIKTNITFKVPFEISTELFSVCRLLQKIQQTTYKPKEDFKPGVISFNILTTYLIPTHSKVKFNLAGG